MTTILTREKKRVTRKLSEEKVKRGKNSYRLATEKFPAVDLSDFVSEIGYNDFPKDVDQVKPSNF